MATVPLLICLTLGISHSVLAQTYIDVEPDEGDEVGSLNRAVEDNGEDGVIFRLQRGGVYWTDANITADYHLHIEAEEGDGPPPMIRPAVDLVDGTSDHPIHAEGDLTLRGIYYAGLDDVGNWMGNTRLRSEDTRAVLDNMYFDYHTCFILRSDADNTSWFVTDSQFRHMGQETDPNCGRVYDSRGNDTDSLVFVNNTMYLGTHFVIRPHGGTVNYLEFDHNTVVDWGYHLDIGLTREVVFTNNLLMNLGFRGNSGREGVGYSDHSLLTFMRADSIEAYNDDERDILISNNNMGTLRQEYKDVLESHFVEGDSLWEDPVDTPFLHEQLIDSVGDHLMDIGVLVMENNIQEPEEEGLQFEDRPDVDSVVEYVDAFLTDPSQDLPAPWDRRDNLDVGVDEWRNFSYNTDAESYTAAQDGFPLGDLNWFPEQKQAWEEGDPVSVEKPDVIASEFKLLGNYPNPFNPVTNIAYELASPSEVNMQVYNVLGENVGSINLGMQSAGFHTTSYDASGLSSGVYIVRMQVEGNVQNIRMTLIK
ncbi:MAG: T9SS type A sorting domain-containing protein [Balneolales bacterium]